MLWSGSLFAISLRGIVMMCAYHSLCRRYGRGRRQRPSFRSEATRNLYYIRTPAQVSYAYPSTSSWLKLPSSKLYSGQIDNLSVRNKL